MERLNVDKKSIIPLIITSYIHSSLTPSHKSLPRTSSLNFFPVQISSAYSAVTIAPPATAPTIRNHTPVGAAPPELVELDWLELSSPLAALALLVVPLVVFAPAPPLLVVLTTVAAVALPVINPTPWLPVGVKYKLTTVWLGN
jgi:hypothetical protein